MNKKFFLAVAVLVGSMVGVGIFALPYAFSQAGFWLGMGLLVAIGLVTLLIDLMFGEVILRTHAQHQILGYGRLYLGAGAQRLLFFSAVLMGYVALLAYIIISGDFLNTLLSWFFYAPVSTYSIIFAVVLSMAVLLGIKRISRIELFFSCLFIAVIGVIFVAGWPAIQPANFTGIDQSNLGLPYGVLLFAFGGLLSMPIMRRILVGQERKLGLAITTAIFITAVLYAVFTTTVVGISGAVTTQDAVSGLYQFLGSKIIVLSSFFGILAISSGFLLIASGLVNTFHLDFKIHKFNAWLLVVVPPLIMFMFGIRTFVGIISFGGGIALAMEQIIVVFLFAKAKSKGDRLPEYSLNIPTWLLYVIISVLSLGIVYFLFIR